VFSSLKLQRLRLFSKLSVNEDSSFCSRVAPDCCHMDIDENDVELVDSAIVAQVGDVSETEQAALFYIAGYVQHKIYGCGSDSSFSTSASEFTEMLDRGKLKFPSEELFQFVQFAYSLFNTLSASEKRHSCSAYIARLFSFLRVSLPFSVEEKPGQEKTIANCFLKGWTKLDASATADIDERKVRKLS